MQYNFHNRKLSVFFAYKLERYHLLKHYISLSSVDVNFCNSIDNYKCPKRTHFYISEQTGIYISVLESYWLSGKTIVLEVRKLILKLHPLLTSFVTWGNIECNMCLKKSKLVKCIKLVIMKCYSKKKKWATYLSKVLWSDSFLKPVIKHKYCLVPPYSQIDGTPINNVCLPKDRAWIKLLIL